MADNKQLGNASLVLSVDQQGLVKGLQQSYDYITNTLAGLKNKLVMTARLDSTQITSQLKGIQGQLASINFSQFATASMNKGAFAFNKMDWGLIGAGIGTAIGGPLGGVILGVVGSVFDSMNERTREMRANIEAMRPLANVSGIDPMQLEAIRMGSGLSDINREMEHFQRVRSEAVSAPTGTQAQWFRQMGIDPATAPNIQEITSALGGLDSTQRSIMAHNLFGRGGQALGAYLGTRGAAQDIQANLQRQTGTAGSMEATNRARIRANAIARVSEQSGVWQWATQLTSHVFTDVSDRINREVETMTAFEERQRASARQVDASAGLNAAASDLTRNLNQQTELIQHQLTLTHDMTEAERTLFQLRRDGAAADVIDRANAVAERNRLVNLQAAMNHLPSQQFADQLNAIQARVMIPNTDEWLGPFLPAEEVVVSDQVRGRALQAALTQQESALGLNNLSRSASSILEGSREAVLASQSRSRVRFEDNIQERILAVQEQQLRVETQEAEDFRQWRNSIGVR